jgi:hypothetical protein
MSVTNFILYVSVPVLLGVGWTQFYKSNSWIALYAEIMVMGSRVVRIYGFVCTLLGFTVIYFHNVWSGPPILLTIIGWLVLSEGLFCFFLPDVSIKSFSEGDS